VEDAGPDVKWALFGAPSRHFFEKGGGRILEAGKGGKNVLRTVIAMREDPSQF